MGKSLVIVESPAKAKTINRYLGDDFIVKSSVGHIRDLPTGASRETPDPKERARQAALTRKMSPEDKASYKEKKAKTQRRGDPGRPGPCIARYSASWIGAVDVTVPGYVATWGATPPALD